MSVNYTIQQTTDLQEMAHPVVFPDALLTPGDAAAHRLVLTVKDGGSAADLSGYTAYGYFERVGGTIIAVPGEIAGNTVTLSFTRSCYAFPGRLRLLVRVSDSAGSVITLADDLFRVGQGLGNEVIDEGELIASLPELLTAVERLEAANTYAETFGDRVITLEKSTTGSWFPAMQVGGISTVDGSNTSSTNASGKARSRSVEYIPYSEGQVVTPANRALIREHAAVGMDQETFDQKAAALDERFRKADARLNRLNAERQDRVMRASRVRGFIETLRGQAGPIDVWSEQAWSLLVTQVTVHADGSAEFLFRGENRITVG